MDEKVLTSKQVYILVFAIVAGIAFIETSAGAMWTLGFWKEFLLKLLIYGVVTEIVVLLISNSLKKK